MHLRTLTLQAIGPFAGRHTANLDGVDHHYSTAGVPVLSGAMAFLSCRLITACACCRLSFLRLTTGSVACCEKRI